MIPEKTTSAAEVKEATPPLLANPAVINAASLIANATRGMDDEDSKTMLHMIVRLCQFHLDNGYLR